MSTAALLNHLWQSTAFLAAAALVAFLLRGRQARVRFWVWMAASLKFLVPFSALAAAGQWLRWPASPVVAAPAALAALSRPFTPAQIVWLGGGHATAAASTGGPGWLAPLLLAVAAGGSVALAVRWWRRWRALACLARAATPARLQGVAVRLSAAPIEPGVFGVWHPVLLLPRALIAELSPKQLAAVLAHEQCHLRRRDNGWAALHMVVETLFWFHPLVWWLGARMVAERERACDEEVLRRGGDREVYAASLLQVCRYYLHAPLACASGIAGGPLQQRVRQVLQGGWGASLGRGRRWVLYGLALVALGGPVAAGLLLAQSAATPPLQFEAATIKPAALPSSTGGWMLTIRVGLRIDPLHLTASNMSLAALIEAAYGIKSYQLSAPSWMQSQRFDINAVSSSPLSHDQMVALLRPFLTRQFAITSHFATKTMPSYTLETAPGGFKGKPAKPGDKLVLPERHGATAHLSKMTMTTRTASAGAPGPAPAGAGGGAGDVVMSFTPNGEFAFNGIGPISTLVRFLTQQMNRPVVDQTKLQGTYAIHLTFKPEGGVFMMHGIKVGRAMPVKQASAAGAALAASSPNPTPTAPAVSLKTALQQQLGLQLVARKGPVQVLVIDHANQHPAGN